MSGAWKSIKKVFKPIFKVVKVIAVIAVVAAAIYFTAGAAGAAFPSIAGFTGAIQGAAGGLLAGIGSAASSVWQAGVNLVAGSAAETGVAAGTASAAGGTAAAGGAVAGEAAAAGATTAGMTAAAEATAAGLEGYTVAGGLAGAEAGGGAGLLAGLKGLSTVDKLLIAKLGSDTISGLTAPTLDEKAKAAAEFRGSFYGREDGGQGPGSFIPREELFTPPKPVMQPIPQVNAAPESRVPTTSQVAGRSREAALYPQADVAQDLYRKATTPNAELFA